MNKKEYFTKTIVKTIIKSINELEDKYSFKPIIESNNIIIFYDNLNNKITIYKTKNKIDLEIKIKTNIELLKTINRLSYCYNELMKIK